MGMRPSAAIPGLDPGAILPDDQIGHVYDNVRTVAENIDDINAVADGLALLPDLGEVGAAVAADAAAAAASKVDAEAAAADANTAKNAAVAAQAGVAADAAAADADATAAANSAANAALSAVAANAAKVAAEAAAASFSVSWGEVVGTLADQADLQAALNAKAAAAHTHAPGDVIAATGARLLGKLTAGVGAMSELSAADATSLLNNFTSALKGLVPGSGGGTTNFLRADGSWAPPPGGGGGAAWGGITGTLSDQSDLNAALTARSLLAGGNTFSGDQIQNGDVVLRSTAGSLTTKLKFYTSYAGGYFCGHIYGHDISSGTLVYDSDEHAFHDKPGALDLFRITKTLVTSYVGFKINDDGAGNAKLTFGSVGNIESWTGDGAVYHRSQIHKFQNLAGSSTYLTIQSSGITSTVDVIVPDEAYDATGWDGDLSVPTKNAVRDKFVALEGLVVGAMVYQGTWNATTNTPTIPAAAAGNKGQFYKVATAGTTNVSGITDWAVGDWLVSNGASWDKIDNTEAVSSVAGLSGAISASGLKTALSLVKADVGLGNVDNTSDATKFTSTALTGTPTAPTAAAGVKTTQIATTAFVNTPGIQTAGSNTITPTFADDLVQRGAVSAAPTFANPTGTAQDGWMILVRIKANGAYAISYGTQYRAVGITLPTVTVNAKWIYFAMVYNSADTKWDVLSTGTEA